MKKIFKFLSPLVVLALFVTLVPIIAGAVQPPSTPPSIVVNTINGQNAPFTFSCPANPLFSPVTLSGNGAGSAPPGNIDQYGVSIDWGDGSPLTVATSVFTPSSGQGNFTFTFNAGPHPYVAGSTNPITAKLFHQGPTGNDNQIDDTFTVPVCVVPEPPATLTVIKHVINDDIETTLASGFNLHVLIGTIEINNSPAAGSETGVVYTIAAGTYTISEDPNSSYSATFSASCPNGAITLASNESKTCTITNDDIAPLPNPTLTLVKTVIIDNGGTAVDADWTLSASGPTPISGVEGDVAITSATVSAGTYNLSESGPAGYSASDWVCVGGTQDDADTVTLDLGESATCTITNDDQQAYIFVNKIVINDNGGNAEPNDFLLTVGGNPVSDEVAYVVNPGTYTVGETNLPGYTAGTWGGSCDSQGSVTVALGEIKTCTITNSDNAPSLTLVKEVTNDNGGEATADQWILSANGAGLEPTNLSGAGGASSDGSFKADTYTLSESIGPSGYTAGSWSCTGDVQNSGDQITLGLGQSATCTITNNDQQATLTVVKEVNNDDGGTLGSSDFPLFVNDTEVTSGALNSFNAGSYTVSETNQDGYVGTINGDCAADGSITLSPGQDATCTIVNDDVAPGLTVIKQVTTDNGGTAVVGNFTLHVTNSEQAVTDVTSGSANTFSAGVYTISESGGPSGYAATFSGDCDSNGQITLEVGDATQVCTITNDDVAPTVTINKIVTNDDGGTAGVDDFGLSVGGTPVTSGQSLSVQANVPIELVELSLTGYSFVSITGDEGCPSESGGTVTLSEGQNIACTITNDDQPGTLIVEKVVVGGEAQASDFLFQVNGGEETPFNESGEKQVTVDAGTYSVIEVTDPNYTAAYDNCSEVEIANGGEATCTITNTFVPTPVLGCTDPEATNYNPDATQDDESCTYPPPPITYQCSDDADNDEDGVTDASDPGCHTDGDANNPDSYNEEDNDETDPTPQDNGGGGGGSSSGSRPRGQVLGTSTGQVLGAETTCGIYLDKYLQKGRKNDSAAVLKVQQFLNDYLKAGLALDGIFGPKTDNFVRQFQAGHKVNVLDPWKLKGPTGIVYLTTTTEINNIMCPTLLLPIPTNLIMPRFNPAFPPKL